MRTSVLARTAVIVGALAIVFPSYARAGSISLDTNFQGQGAGIILNNQFYGLFSVGSVSASHGSGLGDLDTLSTFEVYCVDFFTDAFFPTPDLPVPPATYNATAASMATTWSAVDSLNTETAARQAAWLYNEFATTFADVSTDLGLSQRSALQIAIWNVLYDGDFSVDNSLGTGGSTYITGDTNGVTALAQGYLHDLSLVSAATLAGTDAVLLELTYTNPDTGKTADAQDFIGPVKTVPEPGVALLLGTGLAAVTAFRSRKSLRRG